GRLIVCRMSENSVIRDKYYEWANEVFARSPFDAKTSNLMGLVAALISGYEGAVSYFYFSAQKAGATAAELAAVANIAAAAAGLNVYGMMPRSEAQTPPAGNEPAAE
ncbi:MAG: carboxymuconolactone decarboxylase family protein, partial [Chloroflexi bacterium]|nr:carboxymuconolactone decarboxylase family protein [Chloroflexota bacterium]MCI0648337.1 carboxymuconolactone decarboxylase family protein [Chloroflexota bacterium]